MTLLDGEILWNLIWILPLLAILFYYACRKRKALLDRFLGAHADDPACVNASSALRFWRGVLFAGTVILLIVAAARPSWGFRILPYSGQGRDLMVVFDVSKSMLSQDVRPSRLDHAKWLVRQLCERNPGDRFGLIAFAGHAFLECPLTIDRTSFLQSVDELSTDSIPVGGTNIQQALSEAIRGFRAAETPHRAVILITDGDELTGDSKQAIGAIVKLKIPLFILGIGDPSQPAIVQLPDGKGGIQTLKDSSGNVVSVPLNEKMLSALARETGGIYVRSTTTEPNLDPIEAGIRRLEKHEIDSGKQTRPIERPLYPLIGALILFCCWLLLGERRSFPRRSTAKILFLTFGLGTALSLSLPAKEQSSALPGSPAAVPQETKAEKRPAKPEPELTPEQLYNQGLQAQTQEKDPAKAVRLYEQAIAAVNAAPEVRSRSAQNLGVMNHQKARAMLQQAMQTVQAQQLDGALQQTEGALKQLAATEEIYREALREGSSESPARNQHQLLQDRRKAEELKKKIEELKKQQQQARQDTQQARDQQKQQDRKKQQDQKKDDQKQQQDQKQNQQKQDQQKDQQKQDQQQDQQKDQQQQNRNSQQQNQTDKARESVRKLEQQARELNQKKLEDQAKQAGEEIDKARQAQAKNQKQEAEKHLQKALDHLGKDQPKQDQQKQDRKNDQKQDRKNDQKQDQKNDQKQDQQKPDKPLPKPGEESKPGSKPEPEKEIDKDQAQALLELMAGDEKKLKDELKARMKQNYGTRPVEKDW